jgi:hypothetical protein
MQEKKNKYKPCCDKICGFSDCKTRGEGACACLCRLLDEIELCKDLIDKKAIKLGSAIIYSAKLANMQKLRMTRFEIDDTKARLKRCQEKLKEYLV